MPNYTQDVYDLLKKEFTEDPENLGYFGKTPPEIACLYHLPIPTSERVFSPVHKNSLIDLLVDLDIWTKIIKSANNEQDLNHALAFKVLTFINYGSETIKMDEQRVINLFESLLNVFISEEELGIIETFGSVLQLRSREETLGFPADQGDAEKALNLIYCEDGTWKHR